MYCSQVFLFFFPFFFPSFFFFFFLFCQVWFQIASVCLTRSTRQYASRFQLGFGDDLNFEFTPFLTFFFQFKCKTKKNVTYMYLRKGCRSSKLLSVWCGWDNCQYLNCRMEAEAVMEAAKKFTASASLIERKARPDTRLPKSRAGGQGPYLRSPDYLGRSSEVKEIKS